MKQVSIRPVWTIQDPEGPPLPARLIELLVQVSERGSLLLAARALGLSYRRAWDLVRLGEQQFQAQLLLMERGRGSTLTPLGARIVWADKRINARLKPSLESLASELAEALSAALSEAPNALRIHASHGFAIERLIERLTRDGLKLGFSYASSSAAAAALREGACDVAGLHIPIGPMEAVVLAHYRRWLQGMELMLVDIATRRQGLMVRPGNPKEVYALADLVRPNLRFINREPGSGTRLLLEALLRAQGIAETAIAGFEHGEYTHAAVAAHVASGMADVGFGLEPPARHFKLDFVPVATERYFLLCRDDVMDTPAVQAVLAALRDPAFRATLASLPGYDPAATGALLPLKRAYPSLGAEA
ncbi:MAG: helix-turn-helix transcriptional regulator [Burkholderiales bacterium]|nr:LysR family transcriptional regulator [Burkholderiales bacterium]MDE2158624.1 helix-turn-helix transcriptional regulator [Burkholderiales bacterium]MDE2505550.1 helix-turn-helix transcriptional regulator [Burkholderiales bacterium]